MNEKENTVKILVDFVEGKISIKDFKFQFDNNPMVKKVLEDDPQYPKNRTYSEYFSKKPKNTTQYLEMKKWTKISDQLNTWGAVENFLLRQNYSFEPTKYYIDKFDFLLDIQPSWVEIEDDEFLINRIITKMPKNLQAKRDKIKWCKDEIKKLFKYVKSPPPLGAACTMAFCQRQTFSF